MSDARPTHPSAMRWSVRVLLLLVAVLATLPGAATADQASQPSSPAAAGIATGKFHSCAMSSGAVRCWGYGGDGQLGYGNRNTIGDDEVPGSVGPVDVGPGRTVKAVVASAVQTCALLDDGGVRCWGFGGEGRLGYGNTSSIGDDETPGSVEAVNFGPGRTAKAITAGGAHVCVLLDDDRVRCWGFGFDGRLGYGNANSIGDDEPPAAAGPVALKDGQTAKAITAGLAHTCAILASGDVSCWGFGGSGRLGYGNNGDVARTPETTPEKTGTVDLGTGRTAKAISAGSAHTCAILDDDTLRCWGTAGGGRLGYANGNSIGDDEPAGAGGPVDLGPGRKARAISAGGEHTCAILDDASVRCWGFGAFGQLGYGNGNGIGDDETPGSVGPVDLGPGRTATAIATGDLHTCARLDDASVRCWGYGANARLGYCGLASVGDDEKPGARGPVDLGAGGAACATPMPTPTPTYTAPTPEATPTATPIATPMPTPGSQKPADPRKLEKARARRLRACLRAAGKRPKPKRKRARKACLKRHGRTPGRVKNLRAKAVSAHKAVLSFNAPGSAGSDPPAARTYLIKQSRRPLRHKRAFRRAHALCKGSCRFKVGAVGATIKLSVTRLRRGSRYYYAVAARDNVSRRLGPRSSTVKIRTRRRG